MPYFVQRITRFAELQSLAAEWEEIDALSFPRTPFTSPVWNLLWWRHFREKRLWIRDELFVLTVRDEHQRLIALAPLMRTSRPAWGPLRMREIQFFGADFNVTELRGPVCRPEHRTEATRVLHGYLMECSAEWDRLHWGGVPAEQSEALGLPPPWRSVEDYYLRLPGSWQELASGLSRNMKEALRKCYNSLKREGHAFTFHAAGRPEDVNVALNEFFRLHRARAQLADTVTHNDSFGTGRARRFLRDYAHRMAQRGQLRIFQLIIDETVVATRIGFVLGTQLYLYYSGYSPHWRKFSVMTTLTVEAVRWAIEQRLEIVNLSTGRDHAKLRWQPAVVEYTDHTLKSPASQGRWVQDKALGILRHEPIRSILHRLLGSARRGG
jgi:CelD/BcsL family acetyltransferase involved in cellulose biosynthesis